MPRAIFSTMSSSALNVRARQEHRSALQTQWRRVIATNPRHLAILFWVYVAQALAGSVIGFTAPFLYYFGVL
jgi:hypothetical protein